MRWKKRAMGGWITDDGFWMIRGPIFGHLYWIYSSKSQSRYSPTGEHEDAVSFKTLDSAKRYIKRRFYS